MDSEQPDGAPSKRRFWIETILLGLVVLALIVGELHDLLS